jgi:hypothetical protein
MHDATVQGFSLPCHSMRRSLDGRIEKFCRIYRIYRILLPKIRENVYPDLRLSCLEDHAYVIC